LGSSSAIHGDNSAATNLPVDSDQIQQHQHHVLENAAASAARDDAAARELYEDGLPSLHLMLRPVFFLMEETVSAESRTRAVVASLFDYSFAAILSFAAHCATIAQQATEKRILDAAERLQLEKKEMVVRRKRVRMEDQVWQEKLTDFKVVFKELEVGMIAQYRLINELRDRHAKVVEMTKLEKRASLANAYGAPDAE
jgi:hypothetical protein